MPRNSLKNRVDAILVVYGSWYLYVEDEVLKRLLRNPLAFNNVKQFCKQNPWYKDFKEKIWNLL